MADEPENQDIIVDENRVDPDEDRKKTLVFVQQGIGQLCKTSDNTS